MPVRSLARFGYDARAAIPKLQEIAENDNNKKIRFDAGDALKRITRSPEPKLEKIKELYERGLITKEEYDQKRKEILDAM